MLVTGASGFIGRHVVSALAGCGWDPLPLLREGSSQEGIERWRQDFRFADLRDDSALKEALRGCDAVVHLAGLTRAPSREAFDEVNAVAVGRLVRLCREVVPDLRRFLLVSSLAAAGPSTAGAPRRETDPPEPVSDYGRSKLGGEVALREAAGEALPWTIVRPPIVYGPGERDLLSLFRATRWRVVPVAGWRPKRYSIVFGPDLAAGIAALLDHPAAVGECFFLAEARSYTYREIVGGIAAAMERSVWAPRLPEAVAGIAAASGSLAARFLKRPPLLTLAKLPEIVAPGWECAVDKAERLAGFRAATPFEAGARQTAAWYRERGWV